MSKITRLISTTALACALAFGSLAVAAPAFAANTGDTSFVLAMNYTGATYGTGWRAKEDASSSYIRVDYLSAPCQVFVDGMRWDGYVQDCTVNDRAYLGYRGEFAILQNVREWGFSQARLTSWAPYGPSTVSGWWSPDSWGWYPIINAGY